MPNNIKDNMEEGTPPVVAELSALKPRALRAKAVEAGISEEAIEAAFDEDDVKGALVAMLLARAEEVAKQGDAVLREELANMKPRALKTRAAEMGIGEGAIEATLDDDDVKGALITLILGHATSSQSAGAPSHPRSLETLRAELAVLKLGALKRKARELGVEEGRLEEVDDEPNIREAVIELILEKASVGEVDPVQEDLNKLRAELDTLKLSQLKKCASVDWEVSAQQLEEADDADNIKATVLDLILQKAEQRAKAVAVEAMAAAKAEAELQEARAKLREELHGMKLSEVKRRAKEAGVDAGALEEADDADDIKATVIGLVLQTVTLGQSLLPRKENHVGLPSADTQQAEEGKAQAQQGVKPFLGGRHCMLSYCHACCQETVKRVRALLVQRGVPCWMDVDNGMNTDIYDSMAAGVQNAAVVICFMSAKYEASANCGKRASERFPVRYTRYVYMRRILQGGVYISARAEICAADRCAPGPRHGAKQLFSEWVAGYSHRWCPLDTPIRPGRLRGRSRAARAPNSQSGRGQRARGGGRAAAVFD